VTVNLAGSSEQDKTLQSILAGDICTAGSLVVFKDNYRGTTDTSYWGSLWSAYYCTVASKATTPISIMGKVIAINKRSGGGSGYGIMPLVTNPATGRTAFPVNFMSVATTTCSMQDSSQSIKTYGCTASETGGTGLGTNVRQVIPDAGLLDQNPALYTGANTVADFGIPVQASDVATLNVYPLSALSFGVPVTLDLFKAMQVAQGLTTGSCALGAYGYTGAPAACTPNLNRYQLSALLSGNVKTWEQLSFNGTVNLVTNAVTAGVPAPSDVMVHICQGVAGTGSAVQQNVKFLNNPCTSSSANPATDASAAGGPVVNSVYSTGEMEACLNDLQNGTMNATDYFTGASVNSGFKAWGIGHLATDRNPVSTTGTYTHGYRYVKVDGYSPSLQNVVIGGYNNWAQTNLVVSKNPAVLPAAATTDAINYLKAEWALGSVIKLANVTQGFGSAGSLGLPTPTGPSANVTNGTLVATNPVIPMTYPGGDNCAMPIPASANQNFTFE
jgi:hypothetical protein